MTGWENIPSSLFLCGKGSNGRNWKESQIICWFVLVWFMHTCCFGQYF